MGQELTKLAEKIKAEAAAECPGSLAERLGYEKAAWKSIVKQCLQGDDPKNVVESELRRGREKIA